MSNRPHPADDEPIIGHAPQQSELEPYEDAVIGDAETVSPGYARYTEQIEPYYAEDLEPYYDEYVSESPARNPWFYAFLVAAAVVGAIAVFFVVRSIDTGGDDETPTAVPAQVLQVALSAPRNGDRVKVGEEIVFAANVASSDQVTSVQLLIDDRVYAEGSATLAQTQATATSSATPTARLYEATVRAAFATRGEHKAALRIISGTMSRDTEAIRFVVVEEAADPRVQARVIATTSVRTGPDDAFPEVRRLQPGDEVLVVARTRDSEWLAIDDGSTGERWIRRNAVQEGNDLGTIPVRDVTPTPPPSPTATPDTETPTPTASEPDFAPADAQFVFAEGGRGVLRVSISNAGADFSGPLVVEATPSDGRLISNQLVFDLSLRAGRLATVDFEFAGALPLRADVTVRIDPANAIPESNEDNNAVTFTGVSAPADPPEIVIQSVNVNGNMVTVSIANLGGPLDGEVSVRLNVGGGEVTQSVNGLDTDESAQFVLEAPGPGSGTVQVLIDGATAASRSVEVGGGGEPTETPTDTPTETETGTATATP